jgi:hypothetical protein
MKNNTLTFGLFADAQRVASFLIANRMSFAFSAMRTELGYHLIFVWDTDLDCAQSFCHTHAIACASRYLEQ